LPSLENPVALNALDVFDGLENASASITLQSYSFRVKP